MNTKVPENISINKKKSGAVQHHLGLVKKI